MSEIDKGGMMRELSENAFRVAIFGSARLKPDDPVYKNTYELAKWIGEKGWDVVTGGGPGVMEAANFGHHDGDPKKVSESIGLLIELPFEDEGNDYLEVHKSFDKFSNRLDHFMALSNVVVVMPGGIGTCLELFYTWQLVQVKHISPIPIVLVGEMWSKLLAWVKFELVGRGLVSPKDLDNVFVVEDYQDIKGVIAKEHQKYVDEDRDFNARKFYSVE